MNIWLMPPSVLFEVHTIVLPSGENVGNPSKRGVYVTCSTNSRAFVPVATSRLKTRHDGRYRARFRLRRAPGTAVDEGADVELSFRRDRIGDPTAARIFLLAEIGPDWAYYDVPFTLPLPTRRTNFAIFTRGRVAIDLDHVRLEYLGRE